MQNHARRRFSAVLGLSACAGLALAALPAAAAAEPAPAENAAAIRQFRALALSAAGEAMAAVESDETGESKTRPHGRIVLRTSAGRVLGVLDPCASCRYLGLSFAPSGTALAFIAANAKSGEAMLDLYDGGRVRTLAVIKGTAAAPLWSPDGRQIAVLATPGAHKEIGATQAGRPLTGEIGAEQDEQRIATVPVAGGALRLVSPPDTWIYEYAWTPDGRGFVATAAKGDGDDNWWIARLVAVSLDAGTIRVVAAPPYQINAPVVSPDGATVAFIGGLMSDFGSVGGDVYVAPAAGGEPLDLTPGFTGSFTTLVWRQDRLVASALIGAKDALVEIRPSGGAKAPPLELPLWITPGGGALAVSADGRSLAFVGSSFTTPPEILAGPPTDLKPVTHDNDALPAHVAARSVTWTSDGFSVQGWLLSPRNEAQDKALPMITLVHGGPSAASTPAYVATGAVRRLIDAGYRVFEPNPRGSYGQGEAFTRANVKDLGGGDLRDILAGVSAAAALAPVDETRLGIYGHSYGGFMTMWAVTHTDRFKAAVAGAGIADWVSYYGENGIDQWMIPFFGASAYDDPKLYDALSPIRAIKNAKTPTFIYVGERDVECPAAQSIEFWHGLRAMGTPASLVIYPGEGHGIREPEDVRDLNDRIVGWFDHYLKAGERRAGP
jgi:dipeptidyl aminopeptidase/acylaminoacyl peptidase